jgi:Tol biopolymer transport system component
MTSSAFPLITAALLAASPVLSAADATDDPLAPWRSGVKISVVAPKDGRHTMHSYFNTCPESPDGTRVLFYSSTAKDGHRGEVVVRDRKTGEEKVVATNINAEDAHRVACQQWVSDGKRVVFHGERDGAWNTWCVDLDTMNERILARGQLAGWGQPNADIIPLYSPHWNPGEHRDLDLINVATGEKTTPVTVAALKQAYPDWFAKVFGEERPSIFFPILSPDLKRVFFKMALKKGEDPRSTQASAREGLICYSLAETRFLYMNPKWGHPSWQPDSRHITEVHYTVFDSNDGKATANAGMPTKAARAKAAAEGKPAPEFPLRDVSGDHPSVSPDGRLVVTDTIMTGFDGARNEWGVVLADTKGAGQIILHHFDNSHGAKSWRVSHPHPVFSADGKRIYYNVSDGEFTRLHVAECAAQ